MLAKDRTTQQPSSIFRDEIKRSTVNNFHIFKKTAIIHKTLNLDNSLWKRKMKIFFKFLILCWTGSLIIPLTTLYDDYIDRPKLTEQKKKPIWVYSASLPTKVGFGTIKPWFVAWVEMSILKLLKTAIEFRWMLWLVERIAVSPLKTAHLT